MKTTGLDTRGSDILLKNYTIAGNRPERLSLLNLNGLLTTRLYGKTTNCFRSLHQLAEKNRKKITARHHEILSGEKTGLFHIIEQLHRKFTLGVNKIFPIGFLNRV